MNILVLGHKGMLGHMVVKYLSDKEYNITTCNYRFPSNEFNKFIKRYKGDYIINCIGSIPQKTKDFSINYELPIWLDENTNCNIIHPGTDCEIDLDNYGISKKKASDFIIRNSKNTKIIKSSIIGPELNSNASLFEWLLSQKKEVYGYTTAMWNGNTTLEWAKHCYDLINNWTKYDIETIIEGECLSKYDLLCSIKHVFNLNINIIPIEIKSVNKCLIGNIKTSNIKIQLENLKEYYYNDTI